MADNSGDSKFISDIMQKIEMLKGDIENAEQNINTLRELALKECPFAIGDIVTANGYAHAGKRIKITDIRFIEEGEYCGPMRSGGIHPDCAGWVAIGFVLKKDGTPGSLYGWHFQPLDKSKTKDRY